MEENYSLWEELTAEEPFRARLKEFVARRFSGLDVLQRTDTCTVYYCEIDEQKYVIKEFKEKDSFEVELCAFIGLAQTSRICELLFDSTKLPDYWSETFDGPYFLVKQYFDRVMEHDQNIFRLLDKAAQEVDISDQLLVRGWRDLDGNVKNDAIDQTGRLVRFDLDGAQPNWAHIRKFNPAYHGAQAQKDRTEIRRFNERLLSQEAELISLAVRLSRLFLEVSPADWSLLNKIQAPEKAEPVQQEEQSKKANWARRLLSRLGWKHDQNASKGNGETEAIQSCLRDQWLHQWEEGLAGNESHWNSLSKPEARFLGAIMYQLLSQEEPRFANLRDLYCSLLLVLAAVLERRQTTIPPADLSRLLDQLRELTQLTQRPRSVPPTAPHTRKRRPSIPNPQSHAIWSFGGQSWTATQKQSNWQGQDLVLELASGSKLIFVLADGASGANGAKAIALAQEVCEAWARRLENGSSEQTQQAFADLAQEIHQRLIERSYTSRSSWETTLLLGALYPQEVPPTVVIGRWGNTNYVITYEDLNGQRQRVSVRDRDSGLLGAPSRESPREQPVRVLKLTHSGTYRLRAFTDGVKEVVHPELSGEKSIGDLISEAGNWPLLHPQIGVDDWSIAGVDVSVSGRDQGTGTPPPLAPPPPAKAFKTIEADQFKLSRAALSFWRRAIGSDPDLHVLAEYSLIGQVIGSISLSKPPIEIGERSRPLVGLATPPLTTKQITAARQTKTATLPIERQRSKKWRSRGGLRWTFLIIAIIIIAVLAWYFWPPADKQNTKQQTNVQSERAQSKDPRVELRFETKQQNNLFNSLRNVGGTYEKNNLPVGASIGRPDFDELIQDLATVLSQTRWAVVVEVHTDRTGKGDEGQRRTLNQSISRKRADALAHRLQEAYPDVASQLKFEPMGEIEPKVEIERTDVDRGLNRRIVIRRAP